MPLAAMRAGEVMPGDVAGYVAPTAASTTPATRATEESSAEDAGTQGASGMRWVLASKTCCDTYVVVSASPCVLTLQVLST